MRVLIALVALGALGVTSSSCFKKGKGEGTRATRPDGTDLGSIFDDGEDNQPPVDDDGDDTPVDEEDPMNPEARAILAACFKVPEAEVATVVGWTDPTESVDAANALCAKLAEVKYGDGVSATAAAVDVKAL